MIDTKGKRDVSITDIPWAYLSAENKNLVHLKLEGVLANLIFKTSPEGYHDYVEIGPKNKSVLYVVVKKDLYRCLKSALLFYKNLAEDLRNHVLEITPMTPAWTIKWLTIIS